MSTPIKDFPEPEYPTGNSSHDDEKKKDNINTNNNNHNNTDDGNHLTINVEAADEAPHDSRVSPAARSREEKSRLDDELAILQLERQVSNNSRLEDDKGGEDGNQDAASTAKLDPSVSRQASRQHSRRHEAPADEFDIETSPLAEKASRYNPPENPTTSFARFFKRVHNSSFLVRYFTYIVPIVLLLLIPLLLGALLFPNASVGDVSLKWFSIWLEIVWLTLWAGRIVAKGIPAIASLLASLFTNNAKKWRDMAKQLEMPIALFLWWLGIEVSFLPTMTNHHIKGPPGTRHWETIVNKIIITLFVGFTLNLIEKIILQLIAISFHLRTYADRIEINKFQIGSLTKLYSYSTQVISMHDREFEDQPESANGGRSSGSKTPAQYADRAQKAAKETLNKIGDVAGAVAGDFTGREVTKSNHPHQVVLTLLSSPSGSQVLARRLYRTFVREGFDTVFPGDLKSAFDSGEEAEAAFAMFDKDLNGDISMEELEAVCVEIGRERKSITASLKDLDSVVSKLGDVFVFIVVVITIIVFLSLISASTAGVLTSAGSTLLALSWLFSATAQEFLASIIFVFVKHPFDVGDRVTIYGNTGTNMMGDDYYVKEIALLYTEFKKLQGHVVQAPNSYLNTLFVLNQRRSGPLAEAVPIIIAYGTTLEQIDALRQQLLEFVRQEKRDFATNILTELREVTENYSLTLNVVFFYKSNWQNELLRIQRRNKFICNMMLSLQDLNIQGPRHNLAGYHKGLPYHVTHQGAPPQYSETVGDDPSNPNDPFGSSDPEARDHVGELGGPSSGGGSHPQHQGSILRNRSGTGLSARSAATRKRVDFSLGLRDIASGDDPMSEIYEERNAGKVENIVRNSNRDAAERRRVEREELREAQRRASAERSHGSGRGRASVDTNRSGVSTSVAGQGSNVSSSGHRNRFFNRMRSGSTTQGQGEFSPMSANAPRSSGSFRGRGAAGDENAMEEGRVYGRDRDVSPLPNIPRSGSFSGSASGRAAPQGPAFNIRDDPGMTTWSGEPGQGVPGPNQLHAQSAPGGRPSTSRDDDIELVSRRP